MVTDSSPIRVLIADDHPVVRDGLAAMIGRRADMIVVAVVGDGMQAVVAYVAHAPDVALIDLRMPEMDGVAVVRRIRAAHPEARIIILTTFDGEEDIYGALQAGARAYLLKDTPREELLDTIRAVHQGHKRIPPNIAARLADRLTAPELTPRELEVLEQIVAGKSNRQIGLALDITEGTVKVHVNNLLSKLDVSDRTQAVTAAIRRGLVRLD